VRSIEIELSLEPPPTLFAASHLTREDFVVEFLLKTPRHESITLRRGKYFDSFHD
jgi:hypothetical protein